MSGPKGDWWTRSKVTDERESPGTGTCRVEKTLTTTVWRVGGQHWESGGGMGHGVTERSSPVGQLYLEGPGSPES